MSEVSWQKASIVLFILIALPLVGFYCGEQYGGKSTSAGTGQSSGQNVEYYNNVAEWQTDTNNDGFSIAYPIDFQTNDNYSMTPSIDWRMNGGGVLGIKYFTLVIPKPFEPQTNFADATLSVGASQNNQAVTDCLNANESATTSSTSTQKIDGTEFTIFHSDDAGAGNYYKTTSYRALQSGQCYAIEYTVHSSQVANYPATYDIKPFDEVKIDSLLQRIIGTFKFK